VYLFGELRDPWGATGPEAVITRAKKCCELRGDRVRFRLSIERGDDQGPIYTTVGSPSAITEVYTDPQSKCVSGAYTCVSYCFMAHLFLLQGAGAAYRVAMLAELIE